MSGHSKWAQIKRKKMATDVKKGKLFSKLAQAISIAAKSSGVDEKANPRLKMIIEKAKAANMTKDAIDRAIKRGAGEGVNMETVLYEGYGSGGVAILVEALTDNKNRTVSEVRNIFSKFDGSMGSEGSVKWMFDARGVIVIDNPVNSDQLMLDAIDAGALDVKQDDRSFEIYSEVSTLSEISETLKNKGVAITDTSISYIAKTEIRIDDESQAKKILNLINALEDHDDVSEVYSNFNIDERILESVTT